MFSFLKKCFDKLYPPVMKGRQYLCTDYYAGGAAMLCMNDIYTSYRDGYLTNFMNTEIYITPMMRRFLKEYHTKFQIGDWVVDNELKHKPQLITGMSLHFYYMHNSRNMLAYDIEREWKLWDITCAKTGDILVNGSFMFIFRGIDGDNVNYCCGVTHDGSMVNEGYIILKYSNITPVKSNDKYDFIATLYNNGYVFKNNTLTRMTDLEVALSGLLYKSYMQLKGMQYNHKKVHRAIMKIVSENKDTILNAVKQQENQTTQ